MRFAHFLGARSPYWNALCIKASTALYSVCMSLRLAFGLSLILAVSACGGAASDGLPVGTLAVATYGVAPQQAEVQPIAQILRDIDVTAFRQSFENQRAYAFSRYRRTEQVSEEGLLAAFAEYTLEAEPGSAPVVTAADSAGAFDFGLFSTFVSSTVSEIDPIDLSDYVLPDDPIYLQDRHLHAYSFESRRDTLMWDREARVYQVEALPGEGDGYNVRRVRYMVDAQTSQLLAVELSRIDLALLYREESSFFLHVRPMSNGDYLPYTSRFYTSVWMPFRDVKRIGTVSTYYGYRRGESVSASGRR